MNIHGFPVGPLQANCYILVDGARAVVIDPGGEADTIEAHLADREVELHEIWLTHAHFDHVGALAELRRGAGTPVRMHPADAPLLAHAADSGAMWGVSVPPPPTDTVDVADDEILSFGGARVHCLHTPGHAPGHIAFWIPSERTVIVGDALFRGSIGRTDLPGGDREQLLESIREKLWSLPPETIVLPGHGPATEIGTEKRTNPFLA